GDRGIITRWVMALARDLNVRRRADLVNMGLTLASLKECSGDWNEALKRWKMQESPFILEMTAGARLETKREDLRVLLPERFKTLSPEVLRQIEAVKDLAKADELFRAAIRVRRPENLKF